MRAHRVRALLMGGQACVFYGAAEFSRDIDFVIVADAGNLGRLRKALAELQGLGEPIVRAFIIRRAILPGPRSEIPRIHDPAAASRDAS